jgi:nucleotide-binding universal stress UspA family protein
MTHYEAHNAAKDARHAAGSSIAPVSRHEMALQRYLAAAEHAGHTKTRAAASESSPSVGDVDASAGVSARTGNGPQGTTTAGEPGASGNPTRWQTNLVVAGLDGSAMSAHVVEWAAAEAGRQHSVLRLVHALPVTGYLRFAPVPDDLDTLLHVQGEELLAEAASTLRMTDPALQVSTVLTSSDAVTALRQESEHARLTVIAAHGGSRIDGVVFGSVAFALASTNPAPVVIIGSGRILNIAGPVVVGVDGSHSSDAAVAFAFNAAASRHVDLIAVHSWNDTVNEGAFSLHPAWVDPSVIEKQERFLLSARLAGCKEKYPEVTVRQQLVRSRPTRALSEYSMTAQLIVVGNRGRGGFSGMLLGSTSQALIAHSACPVVVVGSDSQDRSWQTI